MLRDRAASAALLVPVLLGVVWLGGPWLAGAVALAVALGAREAFRLATSAGLPTLPVLGIAAAVIAAVGDAVVPQVPSAGLLLAALLVVLAGAGALSREDPREGFLTWMATFALAVYVSLLGFVVRLGSIGPELPPSAPLEAIGGSRGWVLLLIFGVWSFDTGAYLVGRRFGRRGFMRHISPSKTVEGVIGGAVATTVVSGAMLWALGATPFGAVLLGPLVAAAAQAGDLAESMLKRAAGAKDSGTLIPGHGGMLDRIDSFLFAAPVVALYVTALYRA
jgi:phosphatidate cytidylyltransferase